MSCGIPTQSGKPCAWRKPCRVHTDEWKQKRETFAMGREDGASKKMCRPACGWKKGDGQPCTAPMPCSWHANARKSYEKSQRPKCGKPCRNGQACEQTLPCIFHDEVEGMKRCGSTLDGDPFERCRKKCKVGTLFCENHEDFPDMGRRAAIYGDWSKKQGTTPNMDEFLKMAYPGATKRPGIHVLDKFCETARQKMADQ